ncbi:MAG: aldo/keto reductase [Alphaproteobacteria bacterium]|jgi:diketogulonate reductase-like aldo/keto reductase|nr:aldo/keto reductase [Alphaproteobacteria bacterium]
MKHSTVILNDGHQIPQFGLGVYQIEGDEETKKVCLSALKLGYRHIDTAHAYQNERGVGAAIKESGVARGDIWLTSKLWPSDYGTGITANAIDKMLARLDTPYIDLLLLHQQIGKYMEAYKEMEKAVAAGKVKSIGLSNFESTRLEEVLEAATIKPSVLQVECHPYYQQNELKKRLAPYNTKIESWYPLGHGDSSLLNEPIFTTLAQKYNKTNAQIILRWHMQEGIIVFPRASEPAHIQENINIFDFTLTENEMNEIRKLDKNYRYYNLTLKEQETHLAKFTPAD